MYGKKFLKPLRLSRTIPIMLPILNMFRYILQQRMVVLLNFILGMMKKEKYEKHLIHLIQKMI